MDHSTSSSSSSPEPRHRHQHSIPRGYECLELLGEGAFGKVVKCVKRGTEQTVAVKIAKKYHNLRQEASILSVLMHHNMDKFNIVKYHGQFTMKNRIGLVFDMLDISLQDYLIDLDGLMRLEDIRTVISQMATAFGALKSIGVIHTDLKMDNIMMVDHVRQPFRVKLIDFGLAIYRSQAKAGRVHQTPYYRAPEIMLGLPFSEAIDIWSLGCVMAIMVFGFMLFPAKIDHDALRFMIELLGRPPDHLLNAGRKSKVYFKKTDSDQWILKTPEEYWGPINYSNDDRFYTFRSLDEVKMMRLQNDNETEVEERWECIELMKEMLKWDGRERITPSGILKHPFITKSYLSSSSRLSCCDEPLECAAAEPSTSQAQTTEAREETLDEYDSASDSLPSGVKDTSDLDSEMSIHSDNRDLSSTNRDKKKNRFKRFLFWTVCSCCYVDDAQE